MSDRMQPNYTLTMPAQVVQIVVNGLAELPYKISAGVLQEIQRQIQQQDATSVAPASEHG